jgi:hypothetical protein
MSKDIFDALIAFEDGTLEEKDVPVLFQRLIDDGTVWRLQGSYGRLAQALIQDGLCMLGPTGHRDYFGNYVPSRDEVLPGTPGSPEYVQEGQADPE